MKPPTWFTQVKSFNEKPPILKSCLLHLWKPQYGKPNAINLQSRLVYSMLRSQQCLGHVREQPGGCWILWMLLGQQTMDACIDGWMDGWTDAFSSLYYLFILHIFLMSEQTRPQPMCNGCWLPGNKACFDSKHAEWSTVSYPWHWWRVYEVETCSFCTQQKESYGF